MQEFVRPIQPDRPRATSPAEAVLVVNRSRLVCIEQINRAPTVSDAYVALCEFLYTMKNCGHETQAEDNTVLATLDRRLTQLIQTDADLDAARLAVPRGLEGHFQIWIAARAERCTAQARHLQSLYDRATTAAATQPEAYEAIQAALTSTLMDVLTTTDPAAIELACAGMPDDTATALRAFATWYAMQLPAQA